MAVIGIDLGTTNSLAAVWKEGKVQLISDGLGNVMIPSVVAVDMDGAILTGQAAKEEELLHPERCASNFKRFMGTAKVYRLADRNFTPEELSALVLKKIRDTAEEYLQEKVTEAVISVPAYFNNDQRYATKLAAELAGIYCERIINEPSAAALTARQTDMEEEQCMLVFDFGGGTLDVSIVDCFENVVEITTIAGDNHLGGTDFDEAIARAFCEENGIGQLEAGDRMRLLFESRRCKEALSAQSEVEMTFLWNGRACTMVLTEEKLFHIGQKLFLRIKNVISKALMDSGLELEDISCVLPAGGSSRMPAVQIFLSRLFGREVIAGEQPDLLIAKGVGIYTGIKKRNEELKDILMTDVCPFSLGTEVVGDTPDGPGKMCMMIERNSILPCRVTRRFVTASDFQDQISFKIYQGENYNPKQNLKIGEILITVPEAPAGQESVTVTFTYNINGILEVTAVSNSTNQTVNAVIVSGYKQLSIGQIAAKKEQIEAMQYLSREEEERKALLSMAERLYAETSGKVREYIEHLIIQYNHVWSTHSPIRIRKAGQSIMQRLLGIDISLKQSFFEPGMFGFTGDEMDGEDEPDEEAEGEEEWSKREQKPDEEEK